eukprot:7109493-Alexandrium_andersonii.AAC.1
MPWRGTSEYLIVRKHASQVIQTIAIKSLRPIARIVARSKAKVHADREVVALGLGAGSLVEGFEGQEEVPAALVL